MRATHQIIRAIDFNLEWHLVDPVRRNITQLRRIIVANEFDCEFPVIAYREIEVGKFTGRFKIVNGRRRVAACKCIDPDYMIPCVLIEAFNEDVEMDFLRLGSTHTYGQILEYVRDTGFDDS